MENRYKELELLLESTIEQKNKLHLASESLKRNLAEKEELRVELV